MHSFKLPWIATIGQAGIPRAWADPPDTARATTAPGLDESAATGTRLQERLQKRPRGGERFAGCNISVYGNNLTHSLPLRFAARDLAPAHDLPYFRRSAQLRAVLVTATCRY